MAPMEGQLFYRGYDYLGEIETIIPGEKVLVEDGQMVGITGAAATYVVASNSEGDGGRVQIIRNKGFLSRIKEVLGKTQKTIGYEGEIIIKKGRDILDLKHIPASEIPSK